MADIETRELEYFLAVAEELHFGRAAQRLSIAQPALSKAIQRIEARMGVQLLERSSRHVALTASGEALRDRGRSALEAVSLAVHSARRAAPGGTSLRLVLKPGGDADLLPAIIAEYATRPGAQGVEILFGALADRVTSLREGRADVAILYTALDDLQGLHHRPLLIQERVALVSREHPLARRPALSMRDLEGETLPRWQGLDDGAQRDGPVVADAAQLTNLVALGRCVAVLPPTAIVPAPNVVSVPLVDAEPTTLVLAWLPDRASAALREFVDAAQVAAGRTSPSAHEGVVALGS